jgi:thymidine kinase
MTEKLTVISGPMFSRKTLELIREAEDVTYAGERIQIYKPLIDDRGEGNDVVRSRFAKAEWPAKAVSHSTQILRDVEKRGDIDVVGIDEVQFISDKTEEGNFGLVNVIDELLDRDFRVVASGLPRDFRRVPFGPMPDLLARAQEIRQTVATCTHEVVGNVRCKARATETQRYVNGLPSRWDDPVVLVGGAEEGYAARCIKHHQVRNKPQSIFNSE